MLIVNINILIVRLAMQSFLYHFYVEDTVH